MDPATVELDITVAAVPSAAFEARRAVADCGLVESEQEPTLMLLVSELVSNSVRHAGLEQDEEIHLRARALDDGAYVEVCDGGRAARGPRIRRTSVDDLEPGGLGLQLVDALADRWGVERDGGQTCVWFELVGSA